MLVDGKILIFNYLYKLSGKKLCLILYNFALSFEIFSLTHKILPIYITGFL